MEAFGPPDAFAGRLAGRASIEDDGPSGQVWGRQQARSMKGMVGEEMQTDRHLAEHNWAH